MQYVRVNPNSIPPTVGSPDAAGIDLYCCEPIKIKPRRIELVNTGIAIALPPQSYGRIADRSSIAKQKVAVVGGEDIRTATGHAPMGVHCFKRSE